MVEMGVHRDDRRQPLDVDPRQAPVVPGGRRRHLAQPDPARPGREKKPSVISAEEPSSRSSVVTPSHVTVSGAPDSATGTLNRASAGRYPDARAAAASAERLRVDAAGPQPIPHGRRDLHRARRITMHANRFHVHRNGRSVDRGDVPVVTMVSTRSAMAAGSSSTGRVHAANQLTVRPIGAIGECLGHRAQPTPLGFVEKRRTRQAQHRQAGVDRRTASATAAACSRLVTIVLYSAPWGLT